MRRLLPLTLFLALSVAASAQTGDAATAVARFNKALPAYSADVKTDAEFLRGLLKDYYGHRDELTASEVEIAEALLADLGLSEFGTRGEFSAVYAASKPAPRPVPTPKTPPAKKTPPPKRGGEFGSIKTPPPAPPVPKAVVAKRVAKIGGLRAKPVFASGGNGLPGDKAVGYVTISIGGKKKRIVEVPGTRALNPAKRAATIAARLRSVAAADALWWMKLRVGQQAGQTVLRVPGSGVSHILTADKPFADVWGTTPDGLAARLRTKIRNAYDDLSGDRFTTRGDDERGEAIEARQEGDELAASNSEGAMERYRAAIEKDKTYLVPYLRIADLYRAQGKTGEANAILQQAASAEGMSPKDQEAAKAAIKE